MSLSNENTKTLEEVSHIPNLLSFEESISTLLNAEEAAQYSEHIHTYLKQKESVPPETHESALIAINALSHLTGNRNLLKEQFEVLPYSEYRELYYRVPFLSEMVGEGNLLAWYQKEAKAVMNYHKVKGDYTPLQHMILFYESLACRFVEDTVHQNHYFTLMEPLFKKIVSIFKAFSVSYSTQSHNDPWLSLEDDHLPNYQAIQHLWKITVDQTTVRYRNQLPKQFQRPLDKLISEWKDLLPIQTPKQVTLLNFFNVLNGMASVSREIRSYSCLLLHLNYQQRPSLFKSGQHARVQEDFINRLRVGYQMKKVYPDLPTQKIPERLHPEIFLLLYEKSLLSLAMLHQIPQLGKKNLLAKFFELFEQVETKATITLAEAHQQEDLDPPKKAAAPDPPKKSAAPELKKAPSIEADYAPITDMDELSAGMGITNMPYVFPFIYEDNQIEIPLEMVPNISWNEIDWNANLAGDVQIYTGETTILVNKLEKIYAYRHPVCPAYDIPAIKPFKNYLCYLAKQDRLDQPTEYFIVKKGSKSRFGRNSVWIPLHLSEKYLDHLEKAFFFIFPPPYNQHLLAIPREDAAKI